MLQHYHQTAPICVKSQRHVATLSSDCTHLCEEPKACFNTMIKLHHICELLKSQRHVAASTMADERLAPSYQLSLPLRCSVQGEKRCCLDTGEATSNLLITVMPSGVNVRSWSNLMSCPPLGTAQHERDCPECSDCSSDRGHGAE